MTYKIKGIDKEYPTIEKAYEDLDWIQDAGQADLMDVLRDHIGSINDETRRAELNLAYLSIMDALEYAEAGRETGDYFIDNQRAAYIEEEQR